MARMYRQVDRDQRFLLPVDMADWLPPDHLVWFVIEAVDRLDTSAFHRLARRGGVGRRGYDPDMLLTLFVYAMAHGVSSSRRIETLCVTDVAFRLICAQDAPDHTVLARFRKDHADALAGLLTQSLVLAAELGMVSLGVVALDGTKIAANASMDANRTEGHLRKLADQYLDAVDKADAREDGVFGKDNRGDEPPKGMRDRVGRRARIDAALDEIKQRQQRTGQLSAEQAERARAAERAEAAGQQHRGHFPKGTDMVFVYRARWQHARQRAEERYQQRLQGPDRGGSRPVPPDEFWRVRAAWHSYQTALLEAAHTDTQASARTKSDAKDTERPPTANTTDPESRIMKTRHGWIQGYNCQTAASEDGFILHARATQDANDTQQFTPTMNAVTTIAEHLTDRTGRNDLTIGVLLADAGYDSDANLAAEGCDRLIANGKRHTMTKRAETHPADGNPPPDATDRERMNHRLRSPDGQHLYKRRGPIIETPNAWLKELRKLRRFTRRGRTAATNELSFAAAVTNLLRIHTLQTT